MRNLARCLSTLLLYFVLVPDAFAASFDCGKASTETEKAICADPELSKLDELLNDLWISLDRKTKYFEELRTSQTEWLASIDQHPDISLSYTFLNRISVLKLYSQYVDNCLVKNPRQIFETGECIDENILDSPLDECVFERLGYFGITGSVKFCAQAMVNVWSIVLDVKEKEVRTVFDTHAQYDQIQAVEVFFSENRELLARNILFWFEHIPHGVLSNPHQIFDVLLPIEAYFAQLLALTEIVQLDAN